jgi:hypothetical protein
MKRFGSVAYCPLPGFRALPLYDVAPRIAWIVLKQTGKLSSHTNTAFYQKNVYLQRQTVKLLLLILKVMGLNFIPMAGHHTRDFCGPIFSNILFPGYCPKSGYGCFIPLPFLSYSVIILLFHWIYIWPHELNTPFNERRIQKLILCWRASSWLRYSDPYLYRTP